MDSGSGLRDVVEDERLNAGFGWILVVFLCLVTVEEVVSGDVLWGGFVICVAILAAIPAVVYRTPRVMLPWEVLLLASLPVVGQALLPGQQIHGFVLSGRIVAYLSVAAVALIIAVELDVFTSVRMNHTFAIVFVVITTMATAGIWAVVQWVSDLYLGTHFLLDNGHPETVVATNLMWNFIAAIVGGLAAGLLFEYYFRRRAQSHRRLPGDIGGTA